MKPKDLCAICASRTIVDLMDTKFRLECVSAWYVKTVCDGCGKVQHCMRYEIRKREDDR